MINSFLSVLWEGDSIQGHPDVFLEGEQNPGVPQSSSEEGGRRASVTSMESQMSIGSIGHHLGGAIANSECGGG